ncbi:MAG: HigA family addiction module antitoxin [Burkholderiaceae bacterium]
MARMFNPPHPGEVLKDGVLEGAGLTVTEFASRIGMSRVAVSRILHGAAAITPEMALRLEGALGTSAEMWLGMQADYDLWHARKRAPRVKRF